MKSKRKDSPQTSKLTTKPSKQYFDHEPLRDALFYVQDMFERSSIPFLVLGNTAKQLIEAEDPLLYDTQITLGIRKHDMAPDNMKMFHELIPNAVFNTNKIFYLHTNGVPVHIFYLDRLPYFDNPDVRFYYQTEFKIPNPFIKYWEEWGHDD